MDTPPYGALDPVVLSWMWPLLGPPEALTLSPMRGGTNNTLYRVTSAMPGAPAYVLRLAAPHHDVPRAGLEYAVLTKLEQQGLPFSVPTPLLTMAGSSAGSAGTHDDTAIMTLTRFIPGVSPDLTNLEQAEAAGAAIGALDVALAKVALPDETVAESWRSVGRLDQITPLVPDPPAAIATLPISSEARERLQTGYAGVMARLPALHATLPRQLCHEDAATTNVLMDGARVTGILDFEFLSQDVRVTDLTVALVWWVAGVLDSGAEWPVIAALARGYGRSLRLTAPEIEAVPTLYRMRGYTSLIHRLGRQMQGLSSMEHVVARAEAALRWQEWLDANGARLVAVVQEAMDYGR
jgi:homoserine kinase type II